MNAAELTNSWFFDVVFQTAFDLKVEGFPQSIMSKPQSKTEVDEAIALYFDEMKNSSRRWSIEELAKNKKYITPDKKIVTPVIKFIEGKFDLKFFELTPAPYLYSFVANKKNSNTK